MKRTPRFTVGIGVALLAGLGAGAPGCGGGDNSAGSGKSAGSGGDGMAATAAIGEAGAAGSGADASGGKGVIGVSGSAGVSGKGGSSANGGSGATAGSGAIGAGGETVDCGNIQRDPQHCGSCDNACAAGQACVDGACSCPTYQSLCDGACIPTSADPANCGGCDVTCTGELVCNGGVCSSECPSGLTACDNACVDLDNDSAHCGDCASACDSGMGCVNGECVDAVPVGPAPAKCEGGGPPILVEAGGPKCLGDLAQTTFRWSLCSCTDLDVSSPLTTDAYDSSKGPYLPGELGGGVGVNRDVTHWSQAVTVGGVLWVAGTDSYQSSGPASEVKGDMHLGGAWKASSSFTVGGDASVVGMLSGVTVNGTTTMVDAVPNACDCDASHLVPVTEIVAAHRAPNNDNELIGLDPSVFESPAGPLRLDLPCGNYYLTQILTSRPLTIAAHGRTALYIDGIVNPSAPLAFVVDPTGELDIFVAGTIRSSQTMVIGSPNYPALTRTYVGGADKLSFSQDVRIAGEFYAAYSTLVDWSARNEIYGSVFAGNFKSSQVTDIHYDRAVLNAGSGCPPPGGSGGSGGTGSGGGSGTGGDGSGASSGNGTGGGGGSAGGCNDCNDCGNQACVNGTCGSCTANADCCAPLICVEGACVPQVIVK